MLVVSHLIVSFYETFIAFSTKNFRYPGSSISPYNWSIFITKIILCNQSVFKILFASVGDPWHVSTDPDADPDPRIRMRIRILGSVPLTNRSGCGSGRPENMGMDPDPQYCFLPFHFGDVQKTESPKLSDTHVVLFHPTIDPFFIFFPKIILCGGGGCNQSVFKNTFYRFCFFQFC